MRKECAVGGFLTVVMAAGLVAWSPDATSRAVTAIMAGTAVWGFAAGVLPAAGYASAFARGIENVKRASRIDAKDPWDAFREIDRPFDRPDLDEAFADFAERAERETKDGLRPSSRLEDHVGEDAARNATKYRFTRQIPNVLTGLGILGTFIGLLFGLKTITFTSTNSTLESVEALLGGVRTAFFTSIAGVILSIAFNLTDKLVWDDLLTQMDGFFHAFHLRILPDPETEAAMEEREFRREVLKALRGPGSDSGAADSKRSAPGVESVLGAETGRVDGNDGTATMEEKERGGEA